ncbi:MAG: acyltransferase family protein [Planctomycetaceae bacterium]
MRLHYLDAMRATLMILGVVLHTSLVYSVRGGWQIHDQSTSLIFDGVVALNRLYRMQAFFIIAGFFSMMTLQKYGQRIFVQQRLLRIALPFVTAALTLNVAQFWLQDHSPLFAHPAQSEVSLIGHLRDGTWLQHLWFLNVLLIYSVIAIPIAAVLQWHEEHRLIPGRLSLIGLVLMATIAHVGGGALMHLFPSVAYEQHLIGLINTPLLLLHLPFFVAGMLLFRNQTVLAQFSSLGRPTVWLGIATGVLHSLNAEGLTGGVLAFARDAVTFWLSCHLCFVFFAAYCSQGTQFFRYFSEASYTIYLFHHVLVVLFAGLLTTYPWPAELKFTVVCISAFAVSLGIHEFAVRRSQILGLFLNGRAIKPRPARVQEPLAAIGRTELSPAE